MSPYGNLSCLGSYVPNWLIRLAKSRTLLTHTLHLNWYIPYLNSDLGTEPGTSLLPMEDGNTPGVTASLKTHRSSSWSGEETLYGHVQIDLRNCVHVMTNVGRSGLLHSTSRTSTLVPQGSWYYAAISIVGIYFIYRRMKFVRKIEIEPCGASVLQRLERRRVVLSDSTLWRQWRCALLGLEPIKQPVMAQLTHRSRKNIS